MYTIKNIFLGIMVVMTGHFVCSCGTKSGEKTAAGSGADSTTHTGPILGMDISHFQNDVDWEEVKSAGIVFVYAKATQGTGFKDPMFQKNREGAQAAGIYHGPYHFFESNADPKEQAENFLTAVGELNKGDMPPVLDLEEAGMEGDVDKVAYHKNVSLWLETVEKALGIRPMIYADPSFSNMYLDNAYFSIYKLWLADYTASDPIVPNTWKDKGYTIWQRSPKGTIDGVVGDVDHDIFNGSMEELHYLLKK